MAAAELENVGVEEYDNEESEGLLSEESGGEENQVEVERPGKKKLRGILWAIPNHVFPLLTTENGAEKLSRKRSVSILLLLYASHALSAWGDRMWNFANSLFVALLYPGSLLLPGIFGFIVQLFVVVFGTLVGDWVDTSKRLKVIFLSLLIQNMLVAANAVLLSFMFYYSLTVCDNLILFGVLMVGVVLLGALGNLATVGNTIAVERDWVVVIADKNSATLAILNANMRRIDLACKLLAPIFAGVLLTHTSYLIPSLPADMAGGFAATVAIGVWNVVSFFAEFSLMYVLYRQLPILKRKILRSSGNSNKGKTSIEGKNNEGLVDDEKDGVADGDVGVADGDVGVVNGMASRIDEEEHKVKSGRGKRPFIKFLHKLATPYWTLKSGWSIFWKQEINLVGFAMASLYLTVLGFSGVTATYFLTQGVTSDLIGLFQGMGGILGIAGTLAYPFLHRKLGTDKTGVVGNVLQVAALVFSVVGVFVPGRPLPDDSGRGYYSVNCSSSSATVDPSPFPSPTTFPVSPSPTPTPPGDSPGISINLSVALVLVGVTAARFGLWIFDLAVSQLIQERVVEEERGVVSGVMKAMNSNMDMLHYVMVIVAPRPQEFPYLTVVSFVSVTAGMIFYLMYLRRVYGGMCGFASRCCRRNERANQNRPREDVAGNKQQSIINTSLDLDT